MLDALVDVDVRDARMSMARKKVRIYIMNSYGKFLMHQLNNLNYLMCRNDVK